jgi:hypothetical protein
MDMCNGRKFPNEEQMFDFNMDGKRRKARKSKKNLEHLC